MYVRREIQDQLLPTTHGWHNIRCPNYVAQEELNYRTDARRYEAGTANLAGLAGLGAAMDLLLEIGIENIAAELLAQTRLAHSALQSKGYEVLQATAAPETGGMITFHKPGADLRGAPSETPERSQHPHFSSRRPRRPKTTPHLAAFLQYRCGDRKNGCAIRLGKILTIDQQSRAVSDSMDFRAQRAEIIASDRTRNSQHFEKWAILIASRHAFRYHRPMRLRRILQLSCVTGAAVAPVVADEASDTQAKAIEVLRATPTGVAPAIPGTPSTSDSTSAYSAARDQRVEQLKGEAELRNAGRDQRQADRKASAEAAAAQRQVSLRQAAWEVSVAQRAAMIREKTTARQNALNAQILAEVTQTKTAPNGTASAPETNLAATPAPAATVETPAKAADPVAAPADAPKLSDAELQQKAVEVLRGTAAEPTTTSLSTTTIAPAPAKTAEETAIEQRAKEILKAQQSVSEAPVAKPEPKPAPAPVTTPASTASAQPATDAELQAKAIQALRAATSGTGAQPATVAEPQASPTAVQNLRDALATDSQKKLEDRAKEILRERQGQTKTATPAAAPAQPAPATAAASDDRLQQDLLLRAQELQRQKDAQAQAIEAQKRANEETARVRAEKLKADENARAAIEARMKAEKEQAAKAKIDTEKAAKEARQRAEDQAKAEKALAEAQARAEREQAKKQPAPIAVAASTSSSAAAEASLNSDLAARAREILRQQASASPAPAPAVSQRAAAPAPVAATPTPTPTPAPVTTPAPAATTVATTPAPAATTPPTSAQVDLQARAQEILRQQQASQAPGVAATTQGVPTITPTVPLTKAQKLAELNALYKSDQVTPAEYHKRRAAILAEP
jgi:hypothetical protein